MNADGGLGREPHSKMEGSQRSKSIKRQADDQKKRRDHLSKTRVRKVAAQSVEEGEARGL